MTITNPVVQKLGALSLKKTISGPGGYTGGTARVFPVAYTCTLTNGPTTSGTLNVTPAQAVTRTDIPTGSVCSFTETLTTQDGRLRRSQLRVGGLHGFTVERDHR